MFAGITAIFNTDGICLYSSSKVELWPIFLAINEIPPKERFSRENMLLVGMWQGKLKGKPTFFLYMSEFTCEINHLYNLGFLAECPEPRVVKLAVIASTLDLPAKAGVLNQTYFNGSEACALCEETGHTTKQGKCH